MLLQDDAFRQMPDEFTEFRYFDTPPTIFVILPYRFFIGFEAASFSTAATLDMPFSPAAALKVTPLFFDDCLLSMI